MNKSGGRLLAAAMVFAAAGTAQAQVVISQVYSGTDSNGASAGASYRNSFVELHNNGSTTVDLSSWSVQYRKRLDTGDWQATPLTGLLAPGAYYLVQGAPIAGGLQDLPAADATGSLSFSANEGYVAIANQLGPLNGFCPSWRIDSVILGRADNCAESVSTPIMLDRVTAAIRKDGGCLDSDDSGNFQALPAAPRNRASNAQVCADGGSTPVLRIENGALEEGDEAHNFAVTLPIRLDRPAGYNGVRLRVKTRDGTAIAGRDYTPLDYVVSLPYGSSTGGFNVQVNVIPNTEIEPDKTFYLTLSELTGAVPANVEAKGTILNDDFVLTPIHDIQGSGTVSSMVGRLVTTKAVITSLRADGFFLQSLDSQADADPRTSEGIFVHTGATPDPNWANRYARVTGTVAEYVPLDDPHQSPRTQIGGSPSVTPLWMPGPGPIPPQVPIPVPQVIATLGPDPAETLERYEGMRVAFGPVTVVGPTRAAVHFGAPVNTPTQFNIVLGDTPRPFREPGIQAPLPAPAGGAIPPIPRWDGNPEVIAVDSSASSIHSPRTVITGTRLVNLTGVLDYRAHRYVLWPNTTYPSNVGGGMNPREAVERVDPNAISIGSYNLQSLYDDIDDPSVDDTLVATAVYNQRLSKLAMGIIQYMRMPDIVGLIEIENLAVLQALANRANTDALRYNKPNPNYTAHLLPGNDASGMNIGYLVKTAEVLPGVPRVEVRNLAQIGKDARWLEPSGASAPLNDRPPLALDAVVHYADGRSFPLSSVLVHPLAMDGSQADDARGDLVRRKRQHQAEFLATYLNQRQHDEPRTRLAVLGDFNAYAFNDGYVDAMHVIAGTPSPNEATAVADDGADLIDPNLINLNELIDPSERYSSVVDGSAQSTDHILVNEELVVATNEVKLAYARINADFPFNRWPLPPMDIGQSDHDPIVTFFVPRELADLGVSVNATVANAQVGQNFGYSVVATNHGPGRADAVGVGFAVDAAVPSLSVTAPSADWSCDAAQIADGKTSIACAIVRLDANASANFGVSATASADLAGKTVKLAVAANSQSQDVRSDNDTAEAAVAILPPPGPDATPIVNGQSVLVSGAANEARVYRIDMPAGARNLRIVTVGGSGDVGLYAKRAGAASVSDYDQRSIRTGNSEVILIGAPQAGAWYITVLGGANAFANVSLRPSFVP